MSLMRLLKARQGHYTGSGVAHDGAAFAGQLQLQAIPFQQAFELRYTASGGGEIFHQEISWIAPDMSGQQLCLWNLNSNSPGASCHLLAPELQQTPESRSYSFVYGDPQDLESFREQIVLTLWENGDLSYTYHWALPGEAMQERSGLRLQALKVS